jgi:hypothetical protein
LGYVFSKLANFQQAHRQWVEIALRDELSVRDARWSEGVAVGSLAFVEKVKGIHRSNGKFFSRILDDATRFKASDGLNDWNGAQRLNGLNGHLLTNEALTPENTLPWERITEVAAT